MSHIFTGSNFLAESLDNYSEGKVLDWIEKMHNNIDDMAKRTSYFFLDSGGQ